VRVQVGSEVAVALDSRLAFQSSSHLVRALSLTAPDLLTLQASPGTLLSSWATGRDDQNDEQHRGKSVEGSEHKRVDTATDDHGAYRACDETEQNPPGGEAARTAEREGGKRKVENELEDDPTAVVVPTKEQEDGTSEPGRCHHCDQGHSEAPQSVCVGCGLSHAVRE
jgi:hypothetical protein